MIFDDVYLFVVFWLLFFYVVVWGEVRERERERGEKRGASASQATHKPASKAQHIDHKTNNTKRTGDGVGNGGGDGGEDGRVGQVDAHLGLDRRKSPVCRRKDGCLVRFGGEDGQERLAARGGLQDRRRDRQQRVEVAKLRQRRERLAAGGVLGRALGGERAGGFLFFGFCLV